MARGEQVPMPGVPQVDELAQADRAVDLAVEAVSRLEVELRQARADEKRARAERGRLLRVRDALSK